MEIIQQNYSNTFSELSVGDVFTDNDDFVYLKIDVKNSDTWCNAVRLSSGELYCFEKSEEVFKVKAKLIIN